MMVEMPDALDIGFDGSKLVAFLTRLIYSLTMEHQYFDLFLSSLRGGGLLLILCAVAGTGLLCLAARF